jgi:hypothetical protein
MAKILSDGIIFAWKSCVSDQILFNRIKDEAEADTSFLSSLTGSSLPGRFQKSSGRLTMRAESST